MKILNLEFQISYSESRISYFESQMNIIAFVPSHDEPYPTTLLHFSPEQNKNICSMRSTTALFVRFYFLKIQYTRKIIWCILLMSIVYLIFKKYLLKVQSTCNIIKYMQSESIHWKVYNLYFLDCYIFTFT